MGGGWRRLGALVLDLGVDPRRFAGLARLPRYFRELARFRRAGGRADQLEPHLSDYADTAGVASGHYFHQDLLVAQFIHAAAPRRHADVGSRVDGFVAHVAAFRPIEVFDIRPLASAHANLRFIQADLMTLDAGAITPFDSVSCLHALEHFGLGRYGDPIDPDGHLKGLANLAALTAPGGMLYLSVPIGRPAVVFNAHRVFAPADMPALAKPWFDLERFDFVDDAGNLHTQATVAETPVLTYGLGVYSLRRRGP